MSVSMLFASICARNKALYVVVGGFGRDIGGLAVGSGEINVDNLFGYGV